MALFLSLFSTCALLVWPGLDGAAATGPPCPAERPHAVCSPLIRPFSDNAFFWTAYCGESAPSDQLMADSFSIYNSSVGWQVVFDRRMQEGHQLTHSSHSPTTGIVAPYITTCCASLGCKPSTRVWLPVPSTDILLVCTGMDCDGPETPLLGPGTDQLADFWHVDVPCAVDNPQRVLENAIVSYGNATARPLLCTDYCQSLGYAYAGLEYGDECYCGTGYAGGVAPPTADASECNVRCLDGYYWTCGGSWRMQIYKYDPYQGD
jgi:hypothetical protein